MYKNWSDEALFDEWSNLISEYASGIFDKIELSKFLGLRVEGFGETPDLPRIYWEYAGYKESLDPMHLENIFENYRLLEEVLTRTCTFPMWDSGCYIGRKNLAMDDRNKVQWTLLTMYNLGFKAALMSLKMMKEFENEQLVEE